MPKSVFTGWHTVTPGACDTCGFEDDWSCNGSGIIYCSCNTCGGCGEPNGTGHNAGCPDSHDDCEDCNECGA